MRPGGGEEMPLGDPQREQAGRRKRVHQRRQEGRFLLSFTFIRQKGWFFCSAELLLEQTDI